MKACAAAWSPAQGPYGPGLGFTLPMELRTGALREDVWARWLAFDPLRRVAQEAPTLRRLALLYLDAGKSDEYALQLGARQLSDALKAHDVPHVHEEFDGGHRHTQHRYERSLEVITRAREAGLVTKSNLILGMGEEREEISQALHDLHDAGCELITITQYLRPSVRHHPVERWVKPAEFVELKDEAEEIGFAGVMSGPLVRSSYRAGRLFQQAVDRRQELGAVTTQAV